MVNNDHEKDIELVRKFVAEDKNPDMLLKIRELNSTGKGTQFVVGNIWQQLTEPYRTPKRSM